MDVNKLAGWCLILLGVIKHTSRDLRVRWRDHSVPGVAYTRHRLIFHLWLRTAVAQTNPAATRVVKSKRAFNPSKLKALSKLVGTTGSNQRRGFVGRKLAQPIVQLHGSQSAIYM